MKLNCWLITGGAFSMLAAFLHLGCIIGGPPWYRFFGAGESMAVLAARGSWKPALFAVSIAAVLGVWAAYAFSGAGLIPRLPLLKLGLVIICAVYLLRAAAFPVMMMVMGGRSTAFWLWSSAIVLIYGAVYTVGTWTAWRSLGG